MFDNYIKEGKKEEEEKIKKRGRNLKFGVALLIGILVVFKWLNIIELFKNAPTENIFSLEILWVLGFFALVAITTGGTIIVSVFIDWAFRFFGLKGYKNLVRTFFRVLFAVFVLVIGFIIMDTLPNYKPITDSNLPAEVFLYFYMSGNVLIACIDFFTNYRLEVNQARVDAKLNRLKTEKASIKYSIQIQSITASVCERHDIALNMYIGKKKVFEENFKKINLKLSKKDKKKATYRSFKSNEKKLVQEMSILEEKLLYANLETKITIYKELFNGYLELTKLQEEFKN